MMLRNVLNLNPGLGVTLISKKITPSYAHMLHQRVFRDRLEYSLQCFAMRLPFVNLPLPKRL